jgi:hypothetical protein
LKMTDIVEMLRQGLDEGNLTPVGEQCKAAADEIESLRQHLADWTRRSESSESKLGQLEANEELLEVCQQLAECQARETSCFSAAEFLKQLQHCQAREKVLRDAISGLWLGDDGEMGGWPACREALALPHDSTALDSAIRQAKREALLDAATVVDNMRGYTYSDISGDIRRMAGDEMMDTYQEFMVEMFFGILGKQKVSIDYNIIEGQPDFVSIWMMDDESIVDDVSDALSSDGKSQVFEQIRQHYEKLKAAQ